MPRNKNIFWRVMVSLNLSRNNAGQIFLFQNPTLIPADTVVVFSCKTAGVY